jgi:S1-C subfamily serine protease
MASAPFGPVREPCPHCAEPVALAARLCPHCDRPILLDLWLDTPARDAWARQRLAQQLHGLGPPFPPPAELQPALAGRGRLLAAGLSRQVAREAQALLETAGARCSTREAAPPGPGNTRIWLLGGALAAGVALAGGAVLVLREARSLITEPRPRAPRAAALDTVTLMARARRSTVALHCPNSVGAGFFVAPDMVLTNAHVLCRDGTIEVRTLDGHVLKGFTEHSDTDLDLGVVRVPNAGAEPLPLGDAGTVQIGQAVVMVGTPVGLQFTANEGKVSNITNMLGLAYLQVDARVNPGNSGGPLLDAEGKVVGIVSMKHAQAEGIGWALPINYAGPAAAGRFPAPAAASAGFQAMTAKARADSDSAASEAAQEMQKPALLGVTGQAGRVFAVVGRIAGSEPSRETMDFRLYRGEENLCSFRADVDGWKLAADGLTDDPRARGWLDRHGLDSRVFVGGAPLPLGECRREDLRGKLELELDGADGGHSRVEVVF